MDTLTIALTVLAAVLALTTLLGRLQGSEGRDVTLLGVSAGLLGASAVVSAIA